MSMSAPLNNYVIKIQRQSFLFSVFFFLIIHVGGSTIQYNSEYNESEYELAGESVNLVNGILNSGKYNKDVIPIQKVNGTRYPLPVKVSLLLRSIDSMDEDRMEITMQITIWLEWMDNRLRFNHTDKATIPGSNDIIWTPDLFFSNEKRSTFYEQMRPNSYVRISPDGNVLQSKRISLALSCPMNLKFFPLDKQECFIQMSSYGYNMDHMIFFWSEQNQIQTREDKFLLLRKFKMSGYEFGNRCTSVTQTGRYSCLVVRLKFYRQFGFYFNSVYFPSGLTVTISWVSFWIGTNALESRLGLGITTLLTLGTQTYGINQHVPGVSYMKAMDVWNGTCVLFIVFSIFEVSIIMFLRQRTDQKNNTNHVESHDLPGFSRLSAIDLVSRVVFPLCFFGFNVVYWCALLFTEQTQNSLDF